MPHNIRSIEAQAQQLLRDAGIATFPVDVASVAKALSARIHIEPLESDISGVLIVKGGERHILVNRGHHDHRQRFTIAHEFGHLVLHDTAGDRMIVDTTQIRVYQRVGEASSGVYDAPGSMTSPQEEREANMFAAALLMPEQNLRSDALTVDLTDDEQILKLAGERYGVSLQAMWIRLQQLRIIESAVDASPRQPSLI